MDFLSSNSMLMLEKSLGFLWTKQAAILDNVANAETPNYKAKVVTFEDEFRQKLAVAQKSHTPRKAIREAIEESRVSVMEPQEATRMDDNGINVTEQLTEMVRNSYQQQYVMQAISGNLTGLLSVIRGQ